MATLELIETKLLKVNNKLVEDITRKIKVYKDEIKEEYKKIVETHSIHFYPKYKKSRIPNLTRENRKWDNDFDNIRERFPLFSDFVIENRINKLQELCQK